MPYTLDIADAAAKTIGKFATLNNYQLAGHLANLDFWIRQVKHALDALDGYPKRQRTLEHAQKEYINLHDTRQFRAEDLVLNREFPNEPVYEPQAAKPDQRRIDSETINSGRRAVVDSLYQFLQRCHKEQLLNSTVARQALSDCGIGIEPGDFRD